MSRGLARELVGLLVAALAIAAVAPSCNVALGTEVPTAEVRRGDFIRKVEAEGNLKAVEATVVSAPITIERPVMISWLAEDGSAIRKGDVVVRFDATDMEKNLQDGREERETADRRIEQREVQGETTLRNLDRDATMAARELRYARTFQTKDEQIFSRSEIIESEIDEDLAIRRQEHAEEARGIHEDLAGVELDLLDIEKRKAQLKIQQAERGLQELELTAPHDGIFVLKDEWGRVPEVGTTVWRGQSLAEIPQLEEMEAEVFVLEADAGGLREGLSATMVLESRPGRSFQATIKHVDALPKRRTSWVPIQYFKVTLELERTDPTMMKPGQRVRATLFLDEREDVLMAPRSAVFDEEGRKIVHRYRQGGFEPVEVSLGPTALGQVVIEEGLEEGDRVALRDPTRPVEEQRPVEEEPAAASATATGA